MPDGMVELKEAVDELGRTFEEFKETNDKRLDDIAKKGSADPLTEEKLGKINTALDELGDKASGTQKSVDEFAAEQKELKEKYGKRFDQLEVALKRAPRGSADGDGEKAETIETARRHFDAFCRKDFSEMDAEIRKEMLELKVLSVGNDTQAGYLAPPEYSAEMIKGIVEISPYRSVARVMQTGRTSVQIPKRTGTFTPQWTSERGQRTETEGLKYGLEEIPTHEMYALVDVTEQMLEDSLFNLESELSMEFTEQFAKTEGNGFILGDSAGKPEGVLHNTAVGANNSGSADSIADASGQADGMIELQHAIKSGYAPRAAWGLNRRTLGSVRKLKDSANQYIFAIGGQAGIAVGNPSTILGDPYVELPDMPDEAANAYPIIYGDHFAGYRVVDRVQLSVLRDPFTQATSGAIRFIARRRVGGQVVNAEAIRKLKCAVNS